MDTYLSKENTTVNNTATANANNINKKVIFKSCAPFTNCISKIIHKNIMLKILV